MTTLRGPVLVVGAGLLGTSIGLALRHKTGVEVWLSDVHAPHVRTATQLGAGIAAPRDGVPELVVVAVPPAYIADVVAQWLTNSQATVTDVGSVKGVPYTELSERMDASDLRRYVGSHPMAGSERNGPLAATISLFEGRPWAIVSHADAAPESLSAVEALVVACGGAPAHFSPWDHDRAVARTSHLPHLLSVLTATQMVDVAPEALALSGQGVRDVTRVAASDPALWGQIIRANGAAVAELLVRVRRDLDGLIDAVQDADPTALSQILTRGVQGTEAIPAKHGGPSLELASVWVSVPDQPGELARLFADCGEIGVNIEDVRIDHDPGRPVGLLELDVHADAAATLRDALAERGWSTHR